MRKLIFLFAFITTFVFGQTPVGNRVAWTDTVMISRSNQFVNLMTVISDSADASTDFYAGSYAGLQLLIDAIEAQSGGIGQLRVRKLDTDYALSSTLDIEGQSIILDGGSRSATKLKKSSGVAITTSASHLHTELRNLWIQGGTLTDTTNQGFYQTNLGGGADIFITRARFDSTGIAIGGFDATNVVVDRSFLQYNHTGIAVGWQGDQWVSKHNKLYDSKTGIYSGFTTAANNQGPVTSFADVYGRNGADIRTNNESLVLNQIAAYSEDSDTAYWENSSGGAGSVGVYALFAGGFYQNLEDAGWEFNKTGGKTMFNVLATVTNLDDPYVVDLNSSGAAFVGFNNRFEGGGNDSIRISGNHKEKLSNRFVVANSRMRFWFDANQLSSDDPIIGIKTVNAANKTLFKLSRHNSGDAAQQYAFEIKDIASSPYVTTTSGGYQLGANGNFPSPTSTYRRILQMKTTGTRDTVAVGVLDGGSTYRWFDIMRGTFIGETTHGSDAFNGTDATDTVTVSWLTTSDRVVVSPKGTAYNVNDVLFVELGTGQFIVHRNAGGTSGLGYSWMAKDNLY